MLAVARASDSEIEDGSLWKLEAVRRASCFCCIVVPPEGVWEEVGGEVEEGGGEVVESLEKREPSPGRVGDCVVVDEEMLVD